MKYSSDSTDSNTVINLIDEDENSSTGTNTIGRNVRFGRETLFTDHEVVEVVANMKSSTIGLDITAGPFGRIYVLAKNNRDIRDNAR